MAEKVSTLIIEANLECEKCYRKIQKVLCKLKEKEKIRNINFDTKKNTVTISGPFDPEKLSRKLRCRACEAIKDIKVQEEKKAEGTKDEKKPDEKKSDDKKSEEKKSDDKKSDDKKSGDKKPEDKKTEDKPKPNEETKAGAATSSTTVNLQFTHMCNICYPWPCSDPTHWGVHPQHPQWPCEGMPPLPAFPGHHQQHPPWAPATPKWTCGGPSYCGGCGSCRGGGMHGWPAMPPPPMSCPGPSSCRGCKGCRIVQQEKFVYEQYPPSACAVM